MLDFSRSIALLGERAFERLSHLRVVIVGVGGVGSWCAEALVRTGLIHLTLLDDDLVAPSNINRQCPALESTLGQPKVEALRARLLAINSAADIQAIQTRYQSGLPISDSIDVIVDAIDSVEDKAELILAATAAKIPIISSMGAALRFDPTQVEVKRFERITGDGLARALRQRFRRLNRFPSSKFYCVTTKELPFHRSDLKTKGSLMSVTATFGMTLASEVIKLVTTPNELIKEQQK